MAILLTPPLGTAGTVTVTLKVPDADVVVEANTSLTFAAVNTPILTGISGVGLTELPCTEQPEKFTPDTVTLDPAAAAAGDTVKDGTLHDVDGFTAGAVDGDAAVVAAAAVLAADAAAGLNSSAMVTAAAPSNPARNGTEPLTTPSSGRSNDSAVAMPART